MPDNGSVLPKIGGSCKPLVSIIVPCYNCRQFVAEAIESAFAQTYANVEVVVVDDGSTDGSPEIVQGYPVRFVQGTHQGVSAARNLGIRASLGEYLVFLDSDDRLLANAVADGLAALDENPECVMAVGAHNFISQSGAWIATRLKPVPLRDAYELLLKSNFIECLSSVLFRRSCFSGDAGFRLSLSGAEDYELYLRVVRDAPMCCHSQVVSEYRLHPSNASHQSTMMLSHTLAVVSEQWPFARKSIRYVTAYFCGFLFWRRKYGRQLTLEMATAELPPEDGRAAWWQLARSYPQGMLVVLISRMLQRTCLDTYFRGHKGNQGVR